MNKKKKDGSLKDKAGISTYTIERMEFQRMTGSDFPELGKRFLGIALQAFNFPAAPVGRLEDSRRPL